MRANSWIVLIAIGLLLIPRDAAWADYVSTYNAAMRAYNDGEWRGAADLMLKARAERSNETGRVQMGGNITAPYVPSFYLGDALMRLNDCPGALEAFSVAERTPAWTNRSWQARMTQVRQQCASRPRAGGGELFAQSLKDAETVLQQARSGREAVEALRSNRFGAQAVQAGSDQLNQANGLLSQAESRLAQARQASDPQIARDAQRVAQTVIRQFEDLQSSIRTEIARLESEATEAGNRLTQDRLAGLLRDGQAGVRRAQESLNAYQTAAGQRPPTSAVAEARKALEGAGQAISRGTAAGEVELRNAATLAARATDLLVREREMMLTVNTSDAKRAIAPLLTSASESLQAIDSLVGRRGGRSALTPAQASQVQVNRREYDRLRGVLSSGTVIDSNAWATNRASAQRISAGLAEIASVLRERATVAGGVPPTLVNAARSFLSGRYVQARAQIEGVVLPSGASDGLRFQTNLIRAASLYATWVLDGQRDQNVRTAAVRAVSECKRIAPGREPDGTIFSPRFIQFFKDST